MPRELFVDVRLTRPPASPGDAAFSLDVALRAGAGVTCIVGPSGAGKSTLLQCIAGLLKPAAGSVTLGEQCWFDSTARTNVDVAARGVAYVFQHLALFPHLDAVGNVEYGIPRSTSRRERVDRARGLLARVGAEHLALRRPRTYSGGEAQRVALARAMSMSPTLLLLDEPFSALDRQVRDQLGELVRTIVSELAIPALHVTHDLDEARAMAAHTIKIEAGRVLAPR